MTYLRRDELETLVDFVINLGAYAELTLVRGYLHRTLDGAVFHSLDQLEAPVHQLRSDLSRLNSMGPGRTGDRPPLLDWFDAMRLMLPDRDVSLLEAFAKQVVRLSRVNAGRPPPDHRTNQGPQDHRRPPVPPPGATRLTFRIGSRGASLTVVEVPAPSHKFRMGPYRSSRATTLTRPIRISTTPITVGLHRTLMDQRRTTTGCANDELPLTSISWWQAIKLCNELSASTERPMVYQTLGNRLERRDVAGFRLPTEAEAFIACALDEHPGPAHQARGTRLRPVAQDQPNQFGLHDISGNVDEWLEDAYRPLCSKEMRDPVRLEPASIGQNWTRTNRVIRRARPPSSATSDGRDYLPASATRQSLGFRVVLNPSGTTTSLTSRMK